MEACNKHLTASLKQPLGRICTVCYRDALAPFVALGFFIPRHTRRVTFATVDIPFDLRKLTMQKMPSTFSLFGGFWCLKKRHNDDGSMVLSRNPSDFWICGTRTDMAKRTISKAWP